MNYSACSSLVNMLNFDTEGKADCMKIIINSTKGFQQFYSNGTLFEDIWFSGAKKVNGDYEQVLYYCGDIKTSHKVFFLSTLDILMKYWPGRSYLVIKSIPRAPGDKILFTLATSKTIG